MRPTIWTIVSGFPTTCPCGCRLTKESLIIGMITAGAAILLIALLAVAGGLYWAYRTFH